MRWGLFAAFTAFVVVFSGAVLTASLVGTSRLAQTLAEPLIERVHGQSQVRLQRHFNPITHQLMQAHFWAKSGDVERHDAEALMKQLVPGMFALPQCVSMMVSDMHGYEFTIFRNESGGELEIPVGHVVWTTRDFRREQWGKRARWTLWDENGQQQVRTWHKDAVWPKELVLEMRPSGTSPDSLTEEDLIYDPRPRIWHAGAREKFKPVAPSELAADPHSAIFWSDVDTFFTSKAPGITASLAVRDDQGELIVIAYDILLRDLSAATEAMRPTEHGVVMIFTDDGRVVGLPAGYESKTGAKTRVLAPAETIRQPGLAEAVARWRKEPSRGPSTFRFELDGGSWWAGFRPLDISPDRRLWTVVLVPEADLIGAASDTRMAIVCISAVSLLLAIVLAFILSRSFARPMHKLVARSRDIASLDLEARPPVHSRLHEVAELSITLEQMRHSLQEHIADRDKAERTLRATNDQLDGVLQAIPDLLFVVTPAGEVVHYRTRQTDKLLVPPDQVVGKRLCDYLSSEALAVVERAMQDARTEGCSFGHAYEIELGGQAAWFELSVAMIHRGEEEPHFIALARDITERKRNEIERLRLEQQVQRAQHMESLGVLAGGIAHDFNNLLMGVLGHAELAMLHAQNPDQTQAHLSNICKAATRLAELTGQMLAYAGKSKFVVAPLDLGELVEEMVRLIEVAVPKGVRFRYERPPGATVIKGDPSQIRQVVMNLLSNAAESYGDCSGVVRVRVSATSGEGAMAQVQVADEGAGMDPDEQRRAFEPFYTTKAEGTGLGLTI
ncbi:MAG: ATP-binding protein, partial [Myxococcota bacterium]